jgi:hypothetical protein
MSKAQETQPDDPHEEPVPGENVRMNSYWLRRARDNPDVPLDKYLEADLVFTRRGANGQTCLHIPHEDSTPTNPFPACRARNSASLSTHLNFPEWNVADEEMHTRWGRAKCSNPGCFGNANEHCGGK